MDPLAVDSKKNQRVWGFFCPLCESPRCLSFDPRLTWKHILGVFSALFFLDWLVWDIFSWRGFFLFVPVWGIFEVSYRLRRRSKLRCLHCGFDPYLALNDPSLAKKQIQNHCHKKYGEKGYPKRQMPFEEKVLFQEAFREGTSKEKVLDTKTQGY